MTTEQTINIYKAYKIVSDSMTSLSKFDVIDYAYNALSDDYDGDIKISLRAKKKYSEDDFIHEDLFGLEYEEYIEKLSSVYERLRASVGNDNSKLYEASKFIKVIDNFNKNITLGEFLV